MRRILLAIHACVLALAVALFAWAAAPARGETTHQNAEVVVVDGAGEALVPNETDGQAVDVPTDEVIDPTPDQELNATDDEGTGAAEATDGQTEATTPEQEDGALAAVDAPQEGNEDGAADAGDAAEEPNDAAEDEETSALEETELSAQAVASATSAEQKALDAYAAKHANDLAAGYYRIMSALSTSLSVSVSGASTSNGAKVVLWKSATATHQRWEIESFGGGYVGIRNLKSGKYLDITGSDGAAKSGVRTVQWSRRSASSRSQRWIVVRTSKGYRLVSGVAEQDGTRLVLSLKDGEATKGAVLVLEQEQTSSSAQLWKFSVPTDALDTFAEQHKNDLADGLYVASSSLAYASGKQLVLSVKSGSTANKAAAIIAGRSTSGLKAHDAWSIRHTSKGYVIITDCYTGKTLHVSGGKAQEKTPVFQYTDKAGKSRSQLWVATKEADGSYKLVSALAGDAYLVLQVSGSKAVSGQKVVLAKSAGRTSQAWGFTAAPERFSAISKINGKTFLIRTALDLTKGLGAYKSYKAAGTRAVITTATGASSQRWKVRYDINGYAHFVNENSKRELGVNDAGTAIEAAGKYRWLVEASSNDTYTLTAKTGSFSGKLLTVKDAKTANNTNAVVQASGKGTSQRWNLDDMTSGLDGVDISGWNTGINYAKLGNFVIVKATEWNSDKKSYTTYNDYQDKADKALAAGKLIGFYHFATNPSTSGQSMAKQAAGFIKAVSVKDAAGNYKYLGRAVLFLDWENTSYSTVETDTGVTWAKQWLDYVYKKTGIKPLIYMNKNCTNTHDWSSVASAGYDLWGAQYLNKYYNEDPSQMITSFVESPTLTDGWGAWGTPLIYQYTATARLHGNKVYDVNRFYGTKTDWLRMAAAQ